MGNWIVDKWERCYPSKWKGKIVPEAIAHPAKFSSALIRRIYEHMVAEGWLKPGDMVIDPFGGVALGALDAMRLGIRWRGIELEPRFADLGNQNIGFWNAKFSRMPHWCPDAKLIEGDSRRLTEILLQADAGVSSPPYETGGHHDHQMDAWNTNGGGQYDRDHSGFGAGDKMGAVSSPPYAGSMEKPNGIDQDKVKRPGGPASQSRVDPRYSAAGAVGSPPYADGNRHTGGDTPTSEDHIQGGAFHLVGIDGVISSSPYSEARIGQNSGQEHAGRGDQYGPTPGQLGAMKADEFSGAVASPPFRQQSGGAHFPKGMEITDPGLIARHSAGNQASHGYGETGGQLANMGEGDFDGAVASPPYAGSIRGQNDLATREEREDRAGVKLGGGQINSPRDYGDTHGQLAGMKDHGHDAAVTSPPYEATQIAAIPGSGTDIELRKKLRASGEWEGYNKENADNLGSESGDDFWMAARQIVDQVYAVLRPGAHAVWVVKGFVKDKNLVDFPGQWRQLCEAAGFTMVHEHHAMLINRRGTSHTLEGGTVEHKTEAKSFFRRLAESKGSPPIDYETVLCMVKESQP